MFTPDNLEHQMTSKKLLLAAFALAAGSALAQAPLGTVVNVNGIATVTTGTSGTAIVTGAPIVHGSRVITTSNGSVTVRLNNGCTINVPPGHAVTILSNLTCQQLVAAVQPVVTTVTTTTVPVAVTPSFGTPNAALAGFGALIAVGLLVAADDDDDDRPLSAR
jgi:hypothetical protein